MPLTLSRTRFQRDVRSPISTGLYKAKSIKGLRIVALLGLDLLLLGLAWKLAEVLGTPWGLLWGSKDDLLSVLPVLSIELAILIAVGAYKAGDDRRHYIRLVKALTLGAFLLLFCAYFYQPSILLSRSRFLLFWGLSVAFVVTERFLVDCCINLLRQNGAARYSVFLISDDLNLKQSMKLIEQRNHYNIVAVAGAEALDMEMRDETLELIRRLGIAEVFVSWEAIKNRLYLCWQFRTAGVLLHVIPSELDLLFQGSKFWSLGNLPVLSFSPPLITRNDFWIKRALDFLAALLIVVLLSPIYLIIALLIKLDSPGAIFYRQTRVGLHNKTFEVWKFRTMVKDADKLQATLEAQNETQDGILFKIKRDPRITRVGQFLRRYSLDELPQIFNVLLGEMSLVGPRPLPMRDVEKFAQHHFVRHEVLPGITGLWQVSGRSDIFTFEEVLQLDLAYIQNWSLWLDLQILLKTIQVVLQKTGAY